MGSGHNDSPKKSKQNRGARSAPHKPRPFEKPPRTRTDEENIITPSRAVADGISADETVLVAEWHEDESRLASKRGRESDAARHVRIARYLWGVISELRQLERQIERAAA